MLLLTLQQVCERVIRGVERDAGDPSNANCEVAKLLINKVRGRRRISGPSVASWQESAWAVSAWNRRPKGCPVPPPGGHTHLHPRCTSTLHTLLHPRGV
jgi:hypothetical protein